MVPALFNIDPLFESIGSRSLLLTPNRRLAAHVQSAYAEACSQRGLSVWETPTILPMDDWLQNCWSQLLSCNSPLCQQLTVLQPQQETLLWERIIREDDKSVLLKPYATAKQAQSAYRVLQLWQTEASQEFYFHPDCARFAHWQKQFQAICTQRGYISSSALPHIVMHAFNAQQLVCAEQILLLGFQDVTPLHQSLLQSSGATVQHHQPATVAKTANKLSCNNTLQELQAAACWAKNKLTSNSKLRIGIILPDLAQRRPQVENVLASVFEPHYLLPDTPRYQLPFNISAGVPLSQTALIDSALLLLTLLRDDFSYQDLYALLQSPFIATGSIATDSQNSSNSGSGSGSGSGSEPDSGFGSTSQLELFLRNGGWPVFSLSSLLKILKAQPQLASEYQGFIDALESALILKQQYQFEACDLLDWLSVFTTLQRSFGWPSTARRLDSIEYQQLIRWQQALSEFSALAPLSGKVRLNEALSMFMRHIGNIDFQAQSAQTPLQVLGLLEASGLQFDALWLVGMNDHLWPPAANPSPFIPVNLQRELNMPHASAERELEFARQLLQGYRHSSHEIIASYALQSDDQVLRASTLIDGFDELTLAELGLPQTPFAHPYYDLPDNTPQALKNALECIVDNTGPAVDLADEAIRGGSAIIKDQAACPFRAFALHRLGAQPLRDPSYHLSAAQRGIALHSALESLWDNLKDSARLAACDNSTREELIQQSVKDALTPLARQREDLFGEVFTRSETNRLCALLGQWLAVEQTRAPFSVVATEKTLLIDLEGLPIRVRIDRIDQLEDGSLAVIDYKTGYCSTGKWQGERLEEPQLPLYSVTFAGVASVTADEASDTDEARTKQRGQGHINTLAFAQINVEKQGFVGISAQQGVAPGIYDVDNSRGWDAKQSWSDVNETWRQALQKLSRAFISGEASVDPLSKTTCQFCHLQSLCRIYEQQTSAPKEVSS